MVIELSRVQFGLKSYTWFQNQTSAQREFDLKSQVWFQTKIVRHEVQLPLYYIHFEITQIQDLVSSNILLMQYWAGLPHDTLCLQFSCNLIGYFKKTWNLIGCFVLSVATSLAGKKMRLKATNGAIRE